MYVNRMTYGTRRRGGLGPPLNVSNCVNLSYTSFANGTPTGFDVTSNGAAQHRAGTADEISFVSGRKYLVTFDEVLNSGTAPSITLFNALGGNIIADEGFITSSNGHNVFEFTANSTTTGVVGFVNISTATDYEITGLSTRLIL